MTSWLGRSCRDHTIRWAWQNIPVLQLPPVQTSTDDSPPGKSIDGTSQPPPRGAVARVESRVLQVKEDNGVENALRTAEEILRLRHRWTVCWTCRIHTTVVYRLLFIYCSKVVGTSSPYLYCATKGYLTLGRTQKKTIEYNTYEI